MALGHRDKLAINSVFGNLLLSYSLVVVSVTIIMGIVSYLFFASRYNHEIEKVHQKVLEQVAATLRFQMTQPAARCFLSLASDYNETATNLLHFNESTAGNNYKIYQTREYLKQAVAIYSGIINAIHIYYKKQNLIISSSLGSSFLSQKGHSNYKNLDWVNAINHSSDRAVWLEPRQIHVKTAQGGQRLLNNEAFTFIRAFPISATGTDCQGLIAIEINENTIRNLIQKTIPSHYQNTFIINGQGQIISHPRTALLFRKLSREAYIRRIINSPLDFDSFIHTINRRRSMVTFTSLPNTEWKIVNIIPSDQFYQSTRFIQILLIILCLAAILFGLALSLILTRHIYNPLALITQKIRLLTGGAPGSTTNENEYGFINRVIDELAVKVQSLRETEPVVKNSFIMGLLYHRFFSEQEIAAKFKLLDAQFSFPYYYVILFQMEAGVVNDRSFEENQAIKNQLNLEIQQIDTEQEKCLSIDLPDWQIGVIVGVKTADSVFIDQLIAKAITNSLTNYQQPLFPTVGSRVDSWVAIHQSFKEATLLQKYHYFHPHLPLIRGEVFLKKEHSQETLPDMLLTDFSDGLRRRDSVRLGQALTRLSAAITTGNYSANHCQQVVLEIARVFSVYLKDMRYTLSENEKVALENLLLVTGNIHGFKEWICEFAGRVFSWAERRSGNRNYEIVTQSVQHLAANLEGDLSLEGVAELVYLSPSYFSKIFKEVMGVAFTVYLTDLRIEKAQELLLQTDLSVQEIGYKVGYNAPAYFIKQFKAKSGYTPYDYRRQFQNRTFLS